MQAYSRPQDERDPHKLPDLEIFERTAEEVALDDEEMVHEYMKRHEFRLAGFNSRVRQRMIDAMIEEEGIKGGWYYWYCMPGCLPDGPAFGPYETHKEALAAARAEQED